MFTGIIKETGKITKIIDATESRVLEISCQKILEDISTGDSIAVDGCCLTANKITLGGFFCDISYSTLKTTTFRDMKVNTIVNLENSLRLPDRIGGHFVSGHIDDTAKISAIDKVGVSYRINFEMPPGLLSFIAPRGSVAVDGMSLTVSESNYKFFTVAIIPHTYENTNLRYRKTGDKVNIEVDLISRYIFQVLKNSGAVSPEQQDKQNDKILKEKLIEYGFIK